MTAHQNAKGPARMPVLPSHGSTHIPSKETNMNESSSNTTLSKAATAVLKFSPSRRSFLGGVAAASLPIAAVAATIEPQAIPDSLEAQLARMTAAERKHYHAGQLALTMAEMYSGDWVVKFGEKERVVLIMEVFPPRIVEFAGPGRYLVERTKDMNVAYFIERAPQFDCLKEGRCFKLTPSAPKEPVVYNYERHLRTVLIRKLHEGSQA